MSLLAGLSQQGDSISAHNADPAAHGAHTQAWSTITSTPTTRSGYGITDAQPLDSDLTAFAGLSTTGLVARTGAGTAATRTITGTTNQVTVTNGDGVSGNPTLSLPQSISTTSTPQFSGVNSTGDVVSSTAIRYINASIHNVLGTDGIGGLVGTISSHSLALWVNGAPRATLSTVGALRLHNYGSGTLVTDSSGNVTASSDARLKNVSGKFTRGLDAIMEIQPKVFTWKPESGMNPDDVNVGFIAQDVQGAIPEAVGTTKTSDREEDDPEHPGKKIKKSKREDAEFLTLSDRPLIAALVNAVKELKSENDELRNRIYKLEAKK